MSSTNQGMMANLTARWESAKPMVVGVIFGLIAGPIISGYAGFQVRSSTAHAAAHAEMLAMRADICAAQVHGEVAATSGLGWQQQNDLARKHAAMPGSTTVDPEVVYACAGKLAR